MPTVDKLADTLQKNGSHIGPKRVESLAKGGWDLSGGSASSGEQAELQSPADIARLQSLVQTTVPLEWQPVFNNIIELKSASELGQFKALIDLVKSLTKIASHEPHWVTAILSGACAELTVKAVDIYRSQPPKKAGGAPGEGISTLDQAATTIRQAFRITVTDYEREEPREGRTKECYAVGVCVLRLYINMHAYSLAEGMLSAINSYAGNIAPFSASRPEVRVQFAFYKGMLAFYEQKYVVANNCMKDALQAGWSVASTSPTNPSTGSRRGLMPEQLEHIMAFAIPTMYIVENRQPVEQLWASVPLLRPMYEPLFQAVQQGDYRRYLAQLREHSQFLRSNRLFLALDGLVTRLRLNLLRRTWQLLGRPKRLPVARFAAALRVAGFEPAAQTTPAAAEFYLSQFIARGEVKGYIHHELQLLMLSKTKPFPLLISTGCAEAV